MPGSGQRDQVIENPDPTLTGHQRPRIESPAAVVRARGELTPVTACDDVATCAGWQYRGDERFPMCSTYKALLASAVLARVDAGRTTPARRVVFPAADLVTWSPVTDKHLRCTRMTLPGLCGAAITTSDNTAIARPC